jgi:predicted ATPase
MGIHSVRIQNFKSIRDSGNILLKPINILIGANGSGKSNFINFFKFVNRLYERGQKVYVNQHGKADNFLYFGRKKSEFLYGKVTFDNEYQNEYEFKMIPTNKNDLIFDSEASNYVSKVYDSNSKVFTKQHKGFIISNGNDESELKNYKNYEATYLRENLNQFKIFHFHDTSFNARVKQPCASNDYAYFQEDGGNLAAFLYLLQEKFPKNFKKIEGVLRFIAPFFDRFYLNPDELNSKFIELRWLEKGSQQLFDAHNFSDGTLRMICLLTLLLQPYPPNTIIIDEPELGLHPSAIGHLAALIQSVSVKSQLIISTQSVNLISEFSPEDLLIVNREDNQSTFSRLNAVELASWLEEYSVADLWEKNVIGGNP